MTKTIKPPSTPILMLPPSNMKSVKKIMKCP